jgi:hypothetical protein
MSWWEQCGLFTCKNRNSNAKKASIIQFSTMLDAEAVGITKSDFDNPWSRFDDRERRPEGLESW